jgi:endonuclease-3 related protein
MYTGNHNRRANLTDLSSSLEDRLINVYDRLFRYFGDPEWWPADSTEEIVIGAILVQSVAWSNVEKAISALRSEALLTLSAIHQADSALIEACILPTLYYRMKTRKLKAFAAHVELFYGGQLQDMLSQPLHHLRPELLSIYGIGPETADDILLYAAGHPSFVIDAYTKRIFGRLGMLATHYSYDECRLWFMQHIPKDVLLYNRYHALIDLLGSHICRGKCPKCSECPLAMVCDYANSASEST